jgi:pyruvate formate lyase activating enzyme
MHEALLYTKHDALRVTCDLCCHSCSIANQARGLCGVRENRDGVLYSLVYGRIVAENVDPVEKKPLFHFQPGSLSFSIATTGCNFRCKHCQNSSISQAGDFSSEQVPGQQRSPGDIVSKAKVTGCSSISYTYVEPTIFIEFAVDCMVRARQQELKNIFVSNGYMSKSAVTYLLPHLDAINIDLKSFNDDFYKKICGARLQPVLDSIRNMFDAGVWLEVTTLLIPGLNDSKEELQEIANFLVSLAPDIPWHVTGFYPCYKLTDRPPTPADSLLRACEIGKRAGLNFVYGGNRPGSGGEDTLCPSCGQMLIGRHGFSIHSEHGIHGKCPACNTQIAGIWA